MRVIAGEEVGVEVEGELGEGEAAENSPSDRGPWIGFVLAREVLAALASARFDITVAELRKPMLFIGEEASGHVLLRSFLSGRSSVGWTRDFRPPGRRVPTRIGRTEGRGGFRSPGCGLG